VLWTFRLGDSEASRRRPSTVSPLFLITQKSQLLARLSGDVYSPGAAWRFTGRVGYARFPDLLWGVGNDTPDEAEEKYTPRTLDSGLGLQRLLPRDWFVGADVTWARRTIQDVEEGGLIDTGQVPGTEDGRIVGAGLKLRRDTRDRTISPTHGGTLEIAGRSHREELGSDFEFDEWSVDLRHYVPVGRLVLAGRAFGVFTASGAPPFDRLPALGGDTLLRGTYAGRYRDRHLAALQLEARIPVWWRLGAVAFGAIGQVAAEPDRFSGDGLHPALGFGFRFRPREEDRTNLRFDWGLGDTGSAFYFALGEAF
jgi:outer membrane protein assembly factor BamA